jgi:hypothetical protein
MTVDELKQQKRWLLWSLEPAKDGKLTKVPKQPNGYNASLLNPAHLHTYAELEPHIARFSGVGLALGKIDGVSVWGVDFDKCCDAASGKFTPESRKIVIALDSYGEYSPSGEGCHVLGLGDLPGDGKPIVRPFPGCKQIEIKGRGYYFTFTARRLSKTPADLMNRQQQLTALCQRVLAAPQSKLTVTVPVDEEERFGKLMAGDLSDYGGDHSRADLALCSILGRRFNNDVFKIDEEFRKSGLYREKWEDRSDYRSATILKAVKDEPVFDDDEPIEDDGVDEYVVNALTPDHEGWFPVADQSVVAGSSGTGKTYLVMTLLEKARVGAEVWGHSTTPREYRVLMRDRGSKGMRRTLTRLGISEEARKRVIRVTGAQRKKGPVAVLTEAIGREPGVQVWFVEGLDLWSTSALKMEVVGPMLDDLQHLAARRNVALIYSVGAGKEKTAEGKETERYHGREVIFGSVAWGRASETVVLISKTDLENENCPRQYSVLVRNGRSERFWMGFQNGELQVVAKPAEPPKKVKGTALGLMHLNCVHTFQPGDPITYKPELGSRATFFRWLDEAIASGLAVRTDGVCYRTHADGALETET